MQKYRIIIIILKTVILHPNLTHTTLQLLRLTTTNVIHNELIFEMTMRFILPKRIQFHVKR